jgi:membrane protein implicated in regulation of membrane protease activity
MQTFYLICFVVGLAFCVMSLLGGAGRFHVHTHWHWGHAGHGVGHAGVHAGSHAGRPGGAEISFFNFFSLMAFLTWFGGTGYLLTQYSSIWFLFALLIATAAGLVGAFVIFWFLAKVLLTHQTFLDPLDFDLIGTVGRISSPIRSGGTGEIIFSQGGARKCAGARSEDGSTMDRDTEAVITRYERGIAYVRRWEDVTR